MNESSNYRNEKRNSLLKPFVLFLIKPILFVMRILKKMKLFITLQMSFFGTHKNQVILRTRKSCICTLKTKKITSILYVYNFQLDKGKKGQRHIRLLLSKIFACLSKLVLFTPFCYICIRPQFFMIVHTGQISSKKLLTKVFQIQKVSK